MPIREIQITLMDQVPQVSGAPPENHTWSMNTLSAGAGLEVMAWLGDAAGPVLVGLEPMFGKASKDTKLEEILDSDVNLGRIVSGVLSKLNDPKTADRVKQLLTGLRKDGQPVQFDYEFSGNYGVLAELVLWAIKGNFGGFFSGSRTLSGLGATAVRSRARRSTSTGESGAS